MKGMIMENQIICPKCKKTITNDLIIEDAAKGEGSHTRSITCDCGENITYWQVTAQLRDQNKLGRRIRKWFDGLSKRQS